MALPTTVFMQPLLENMFPQSTCYFYADSHLWTIFDIVFLISKMQASFALEHAFAFRRHAFPSVVARVYCGGKSVLSRVQTSNDTCVGVESKLCGDNEFPVIRLFCDYECVFK